MLLERNLARLPFWPTTGVDRLAMSGRHASGRPYSFRVRFDPANPPGERARAVHAFLCDRQHDNGPHPIFPNPVGFRWISLIRWLGLRQQCGSTQRRLATAVDALVSVRISSHQALACRPEGEVSGELRLYERFVPRGAPDHEGRTSTVNRIWFSEWYYAGLQACHYTVLDTAVWRAAHRADPLASRLLEVLADKCAGGPIAVRHTTLVAVLGLPHPGVLDVTRGPLAAAADRLVGVGALAGWEGGPDLYRFTPGGRLPARERYPLVGRSWLELRMVYSDPTGSAPGGQPGDDLGEPPAATDGE